LIGTNLLLSLRLWLKALLLGLWLKEGLQVLLNLLNIWASSTLLLLLRNRIRSWRSRQNLIVTHRSCWNLVVTHRRYLLLLIFYHWLDIHLRILLLLLLLKWVDSVLSSILRSCSILWIHIVVWLTFVGSKVLNEVLASTIIILNWRRLLLNVKKRLLRLNSWNWELLSNWSRLKWELAEWNLLLL